MIDDLQIRNFRGIRSLDVQGLGRMNLIIGKNGCGKTTVLAGAGVALDPLFWFGFLPFLSDPRPEPIDFDRHLVPACPGGDTSLNPQVLSRVDGVPTGSRLCLTPSTRESKAQIVTLPDEHSIATGTFSKSGKEFDISQEYADIWWIPAFVEAERTVADELIKVYKQGRTDALVAAVQLVNPDIIAVELAGNQVFVRLKSHPLPMRLGILGDGARRILEFALALATDNRALLIDEIENGFHYSTLPAVIRLLRMSPSPRQIFATTHREEVIRATCEAYVAAQDDGLRIIRIDRNGTEHRAVVYSAQEALAGLDSGLELRG